MTPIVQRLRLALRWPGSREMGWAALLFAAGALVIATLAFASGLAHVQPAPFGWRWMQIALLLIVVPAFGEEILFRGLLLPPRGQPMSSMYAVFAVALFVAWHPFQALTFGPPWSAVFLDPAFLAVVAVLGIMLVGVYRAAGSIWPCVAAHWLVVVSWKLLFAGPF